MTTRAYPVLLRTLPNDARRDGEQAPEPWEASLRATCDCLSWRGALDNLERRHAEDALGETVYAGFPRHARSVVVAAHALIERGAITERELRRKMDDIRARFRRA